jgi:hypothetical protein
MRTLDLTATSPNTIRRAIAETCGHKIPNGPLTQWLGKGIGGLTFTDPADTNSEHPYKANMAFFTAGMGIYFRNRFANRLILLHSDEVRNIEVTRQQEVICPFPFSVYSLLRKSGMTHDKAAPYLMPKEIISHHDSVCTVFIPESFITLHMTETQPQKLLKAMHLAGLSEKIKTNLPSPKIQLPVS